jgi:hypothetical protein
MRALWSHRYSVLSIALALVNLVIVFGSTTNRLWAGRDDGTTLAVPL